MLAAALSILIIRQFFLALSKWKFSSYLRNSISALQFFEGIIFENLRTADRGVFDETFFEALALKWSVEKQESQRLQRNQNIAYMISALLYFDVVTKFSVLGIDFRISKLYLFLVLTISYYDFIIQYRILRQIPMHAALASHARFKTKGKLTSYYCLAKFGMQSSYKSSFLIHDVIDLSASVSKIRYMMADLVGKDALRMRPVTLCFGLFSLFFVFICIICYAMSLHLFMVALYIEAYLKTDISGWVKAPLLIVAAMNQLFVRLVVWAAAFSFYRDPVAPTSSAEAQPGANAAIGDQEAAAGA